MDQNLQRETCSLYGTLLSTVAPALHLVSGCGMFAVNIDSEASCSNVFTAHNGVSVEQLFFCAVKPLCSITDMSVSLNNLVWKHKCQNSASTHSRLYLSQSRTNLDGGNRSHCVAVDSRLFQTICCFVDMIVYKCGGGLVTCYKRRSR